VVNNDRGFGFITDDSGQDVFVSHTPILGNDFKTLIDDEPVTFEVVPTDRGSKA